jgi:hypothetical protein
MNRDENRNFIKKTESLVKPEDVTAISFLGDFNKYLPKKVQHKIMKKGSQKVPYMGFIVEPYCMFLAYEITNRETAEKMIPEGYDLSETAVFKDGTKKPMVIISSFTARTSAFIGMRVECYIIVRNKNTGLMSWIIADYETNTNSHDPKNGFCGYTCDPAVFTTTPYGVLVVNVKNPSRGNEIAFKVDIKDGDMKELDEELWVEGNMSVDYGGILKDDSSSPFSLIFDPILMKKAKQIPLENVNIETNSFLKGVIDPGNPESAVLFPYSQHFIIKQDINANEIKKKEDLFVQIQSFMDKTEFKTMKGDDIKKPLFRTLLISSLINLGIILFLLLKVLSN